MSKSCIEEIQAFDIPNPFKRRSLYDFEICADYDELKETLAEINRCGYDLISVTQDYRGFYTLFFRRHAA